MADHPVQLKMVLGGWMAANMKETSDTVVAMMAMRRTLKVTMATCEDLNSAS